MSSDRAFIPVEKIEDRILHLRGRKVILDSDLARMYGVSTGRLNQAVKRNTHRFPSDFLFRLTRKEKEEVVANCDHRSSLRFSPHLPFAFTVHGAIMAAWVLNSDRAIQLGVYLVRAFIKLRETAFLDRGIPRRREEPGKGLGIHDEKVDALLQALKKLMDPKGAPLEGRACSSRPKGRSFPIPPAVGSYRHSECRNPRFPKAAPQGKRSGGRITQDSALRAISLEAKRYLSEAIGVDASQHSGLRTLFGLDPQDPALSTVP